MSENNLQDSTCCHCGSPIYRENDEWCHRDYNMANYYNFAHAIPAHNAEPETLADFPEEVEPGAALQVFDGPMPGSFFVVGVRGIIVKPIAGNRVLITLESEANDG